MKTKAVPHKLIYVLTSAILLTASFLSGSMTSKDQTVNAQGAKPAADPAAPDTSFWCIIGGLYASDNRIHVQCTNGPGALDFFAYPVTSTSESRQANRYLAILNTAYALNKQVWLTYNDSSAANPPGCLTTDCRRMAAILLQP